MKLIAVQGYLEEGVFHSDQPLPPGKVPAVLTFVAAPAAAKVVPKPHPRFSFDEALRLSTQPDVTISDAVIEERKESAW